MLLQKSDERRRRGEKADGKEAHQKETPGEPKRQRPLSRKLSGNQRAEAPQQEEPYYRNDAGENQAETPIIGDGTERINSHRVLSFLPLICVLWGSRQ